MKEEVDQFITISGPPAFLHKVDTYTCSICRKEFDNMPNEPDPNTAYIGGHAGYGVCNECAERIRIVCGIQIV